MWEKMKACRRYIEKNLDHDSDDGCYSDPDDDDIATDEFFKDLLQTHIKRKKDRKKMKLAPDVSCHWKKWKNFQKWFLIAL